MTNWKTDSPPWDKETCYRRYVEGDRISYHELAKLAGVPYRTLSQWTTDDKKRGFSWLQKRKEWQENLRKKTSEKALEKASDKLSTQTAQVLSEHFKAVKQYRNLAQKTAKIQTFLLEKKIAEYEAAQGEEKILIAERVCNQLMTIAKDMSLWMGILSQAIAREREALDMSQRSVNIALKTVTSAGFEVTNVSEQAMKSYLEAEGYQIVPPER